MRGQKHHTVVIKLGTVGTSSIVDEKTHEPLLSILTQIVETAVKLRRDGHRVVIVSSGAIGVGLRRMDVDRRPKLLPQVQALAAIGQCRLIHLWDNLFEHLRQPIAQILLTRNDIADRMHYLNAQNTLSALLLMGVIPIVNENDTLAVSEIKFGDNDTLSAITAVMVSADYLFLMTDVDCLYTANPRKDPDAKPIELVADISELQVDTATAGSALGTGGMGTKIVAARLATSAGITVIITKSSKPGNVKMILDHLEMTEPNKLPPAPLYTRFAPSSSPVKDRQFWLLHTLAPHGTIYIDEGAFKALNNRASLLPAGIVDVEGRFAQQEAVRLVVVRRIRSSSRRLSFSELRSSLKEEQSLKSVEKNTNQDDGNSVASCSMPGTPAAALTSGGLGGYESSFDSDSTITPSTSIFSLSSSNHNLLESTSHQASDQIDPTFPQKEIGRALVNYSSVEISRIKGLQSSEIAKLLGYADSEHVAHRDNISLTVPSDAKRHTKNLSTPREEKRVDGLMNFA